ncbi:hypothetical protein [Thermus sp.]|uniref:hypothetical protein n=1 Tax=Thermus sp. TaxID=275 RepID=UPI003D0A7306
MTEVLKRYARVSGSFAVAFEEGRPVRVVGRARREDHPFLLELAEEVVRAFPGKSGLVLVSPERVRVAYREEGLGAAR